MYDNCRAANHSMLKISLNQTKKMADHDFYVKNARVRETHCCHFQHSHIIEHIQKWSEKKRRKNFRWRKMYWIKRMCKKLVSETVLVYSILRQYLISHEWHCIELSRRTLFTESWLESQVTDYFQLKYSTNAMNAEFFFHIKIGFPSSKHETSHHWYF